MKRARSNDRAGSALVASLLVVATIAGLGAYMVQVQASFARRQSASVDRKRALYVAEAGLAEAVLAVSLGKSGVLGSEEVPVKFHDGVYWVESEVQAGGTRALTSRALVGTGRFSVQVVVIPNVHPIGALGFFGDLGVDIGTGVILDGYDAREGGYEEDLNALFPFQTTGTGGLVRSNGAIVVDDATDIPDSDTDPFVAALDALEEDARMLLEVTLADYLATRISQSIANTSPRATFLLGEVMPGPASTFVSSGKTVVGTLDRAEGEALLPMVMAPMTRRHEEGATIVSGLAEIGETSCRFDEIVVNAKGVLTLRGPAVLHVGSFRVESQGMVLLDDEQGPILVVVDDALALESGSLLTTDDEDLHHCGTYFLVQPAADPKDDGRVVLACSGNLRGVVYAPGDRITLPALLRIWGSVVAKHLTIEDGAWLTYDRALRVGGEGVPIFPQQRSWQIVEEPAIVRRAGFDPLRELAALGIEPLYAQGASPEQDVEVRYFDDSGVRQTYSGASSDFDFSLADRVIGVRWQDPVTSEYAELQRPGGADPDQLIEGYRQVRREAFYSN